MNIAKNMEAIFIVAVALSCITAFAEPPLKKISVQAAVNDDAMIRVNIVGHRLTAAQKAELGA